MVPAAIPMIKDAIGPTKPEAGVIATSPATAPDEAPTMLGFPVWAQAIRVHVSAAMPVAVFVTTHADVAIPSASNSEPALNPNQPNQSIPTPNTTIGMLCGSIGTLPYPNLLPRISAPAKAENPEVMWTTVPPAKSSANVGLRSLLRSIAPPPMNPPPQTQCATGS